VTNIFKISGYDSYDDLTVIWKDSDVRYIYHGVSQFIKEKIERYINKDNYSAAIKLLKQYDFTKKE